jgi:hypothetical protein
MPEDLNIISRDQVNIMFRNGDVSLAINMEQCTRDKL